MAKERVKKTRAIRAMNLHKIGFSTRSYKYKENGGTMVAAKDLNVDEHLVIKSLVMEDGNGNPFLILMHGDKRVSTKACVRQS